MKSCCGSGFPEYGTMIITLTSCYGGMSEKGTSVSFVDDKESGRRPCREADTRV